MATPRYWKEATRELSARDPVLRKLVAQSKGLTLRSRGDAFNTLARSIVGQQISVKAAQSVWNKLVAVVPDMRPETVRSRAPLYRRQVKNCALAYHDR
jgi:DNA-3-methyladenine glycosylase II